MRIFAPSNLKYVEIYITQYLDAIVIERSPKINWKRRVNSLLGKNFKSFNIFKNLPFSTTFIFVKNELYHTY